MEVVTTITNHTQITTHTTTTNLITIITTTIITTSQSIMGHHMQWEDLCRQCITINTTQPTLTITTIITITTITNNTLTHGGAGAGGEIINFLNC